MNEEMKFPKTFEEFIKQYSFFDKQQIYTNGSELIQVFRIKQWEEHKEKENQELKLELSGYRQAILEDKDMLGLKEESEELKKQLKEYKRLGFKHLNDKCNKLENQQKEFIEYLEDEIKQINPKILDDGELNLRLDDIKYTQYLTYKEILQKYKSITGVSDEKK